MTVNIYDLGYIYFSVGKDFEKFMNRDMAFHLKTGKRNHERTEKMPF